MDDSQKQNCFILSLPVKHEHTIAISKSEIKLKEDPKEEDPDNCNRSRVTLY